MFEITTFVVIDGGATSSTTLLAVMWLLAVFRNTKLHKTEL